MLEKLISGWSFVPCCEGEEVLTFVQAEPTEYVAGRTVIYNDKCYQIYGISWARNPPNPIPPIEPTFGGIASGGPYDVDTAYTVVTETPCESVLCPDCNPQPEGCGCPEGFEFVDGDCIQEETTPATFTGTLAPVSAGSQSAYYGAEGLRLYPDISANTFPIVVDISSGFKLIDNYGTGATIVPSIISLESELWGLNTILPGSPAVTAGCATANSETGRLNDIGVWAIGAADKGTTVANYDSINGVGAYDALSTQNKITVYENTGVEFEFCVEVTESKQYLIGIAADNEVFLKIDGNLILLLGAPERYGQGPFTEDNKTTPTFRNFHVFPITLTAGSHTINLRGINWNSVASFGAEIYDIDLATFNSTLTTSFTSSPDCGNTVADLEPYIIFSTKNYIGQEIPISTTGVWECPDGSVLDSCNGIPQCKTTIVAAPLTCCYYVENCFDASLNFYCLLSNSELLTTGNTFSLDILPGDPLVGEADFNNCWSISEFSCEQSPTRTLEITTSYADCDACRLIEVPPCYSLTNCETEAITYYSGDILADYVGQTIQIIINNVVNCFTVNEAQCTDPLPDPFDLTIEGCYDTCESCLPLPVPPKTLKLRAVLPNYETALCDPEKVEKIKCTFADLMYQSAMSRRFDIKFCCPKDLYTWQLRHEKINLDLTKYLNPTPDPCNPICKTYAYEFEANQTGNIVYTDCDNVAVVTEVTESNEPQRFDFCALDYPGVTINITNNLGQIVDTFTIQPIETECIIEAPTVFQYRLTVAPAENPTAGSFFSYTDENGLPINPLIEILNNRLGYELIFCAEYGSITLNESPYYAANEPCPAPPCASISGLTLERIGDCIA
jgi:hypothetical protein